MSEKKVSSQHLWGNVMRSPLWEEGGEKKSWDKVVGIDPPKPGRDRAGWLP